MRILRGMPKCPFEKQAKLVITIMALDDYIRMFVLHDHHFEEIENDSNFVPDEEKNMEIVIQEEDHGSNTLEG